MNWASFRTQGQENQVRIYEEDKNGRGRGGEWVKVKPNLHCFAKSYRMLPYSSL